MDKITFLHPHFFYLLFLLLPIIGWYIWKHKEAQASLQISTLKGFSKAPVSLKIYLRHVPIVLRCITLALIVTILARPQSTNSTHNVVTEGIDIVLTLDVSGSMEALDFQPNRLEAAKDVAIQFVTDRPNDKIGLVTFAGESFTQCPLTTDKISLINLMQDIKTGILENGTAIGMGLATAVNRIKDSKAKSKVIILLTDGENNRGEIAPLTAAEIAKTYGIRVYTIGVGTHGMAKIPKQTVFGTTEIVEEEVRIDEDMLKEIASLTDGQYFRATNKNSLQKIYEEIDQLEKTKIEVKEYTKRSEEYKILAMIAGILIILELLLKNTVLRNLP